MITYQQYKHGKIRVEEVPEDLSSKLHIRANFLSVQNFVIVLLQGISFGKS